ncbi:unnamed protein product [Musa banksii]
MEERRRWLKTKNNVSHTIKFNPQAICHWYPHLPLPPKSSWDPPTDRSCSFLLFLIWCGGRRLRRCCWLSSSRYKKVPMKRRGEVVSITDFGGVGDRRTLNTAAFESAVSRFEQRNASLHPCRGLSRWSLQPRQSHDALPCCGRRHQGHPGYGPIPFCFGVFLFLVWRRKNPRASRPTSRCNVLYQ